MCPPREFNRINFAADAYILQESEFEWGPVHVRRAEIRRIYRLVARRRLHNLPSCAVSALRLLRACKIPYVFSAIMRRSICA